MASRSHVTVRTVRRSWIWAAIVLLTLALVVWRGAGGAAHPAGRTAAGPSPDTVRVTVPDPFSAPALAPAWVRALDRVPVPGSAPWSAYQVAGVAAHDSLVAVVDAANGELLALDLTSGAPRRVDGGTGNGPDELWAPGAPVGVSSGIAVPDRRNLRVSLWPAGGGPVGTLRLSHEPYALAAAGDALYVLTFTPREAHVLRVRGCCHRSSIDTLPIRVPRRAQLFAALDDGSVILGGPLGRVLLLYDPNGRLRRVYRFDLEDTTTATASSVVPLVPTPASGPMPPTRLIINLANAGAPSTVILDFGYSIACFDVASGMITKTWRPAPESVDRVTAVTHVAVSPVGTVTYQLSSNRVSHFRVTCR